MIALTRIVNMDPQPAIYATFGLLLFLAALYLGKWTLKNLLIFVSTAFVLLVAADTAVKIHDGAMWNRPQNWKTIQAPVRVNPYKVSENEVGEFQ